MRLAAVVVIVLMTFVGIVKAETPSMVTGACGEPETDTVKKCDDVPIWASGQISNVFISSSTSITKPSYITFSGRKGQVTINLEDLSVDMHDNTPPEAARAFWNAIMMVVGKPPLFQEGISK